jgi:fructose/tagatose bisphosphate aldolase
MAFPVLLRMEVVVQMHASKEAKMDTFQAVLAEADRQNVAIGHFNISDLVVLKAAYEAALEVNTPVLVGG